MKVADLQQELLQIEQELLRADRPSFKSLSLVAQGLEDIDTRIDEMIVSGQLQQDDLSAIDRIASRIHLVGSGFADLEDSFYSIVTQAEVEVESVMGLKDCSEPFGSTMPAPDNVDALQSHYMRLFFLSHLDDPYPSQAEKDSIVATTNAAIRAHPTFKSVKNASKSLISDQRLTLWFINARRRSGWQAIKKDYAGDNKAVMADLARAYLATKSGGIKREGEESPEVELARLVNPNQDPESEESREKVKDIMDRWESLELYVRHGIKEKARGWMQEVIEGVKEEKAKKGAAVSKERKASTAASKTKAKPPTKSAATSTASKKSPKKAAAPRRSIRTTRSTINTAEQDSSDDAEGSDEEASSPPTTARPEVASFDTGLSLYTSSGGLGLSHPSSASSTSFDASRTFSSGSYTSTDTAPSHGSYDDQRLSRASSVTSFSSFDEAVECLSQERPILAAKAATRQIRPLPSHARRGGTITTLDGAVGVSSSSSELPINSSPTNAQEVRDRFLNEQPSESEYGSPDALPILLPRVETLNAFAYDFNTPSSAAAAAAGGNGGGGLLLPFSTPTRSAFGFSAAPA